MKLLEFLYFTIALFLAEKARRKKDIPGTIFYCTHMIVAAIYIANT